jgi:hypothetical protein
MRTAFVFALLSALTEAAAQEPLSAREILLQGQASYQLTQRLLTNVTVIAGPLLGTSGTLVWARDGERYRCEGVQSVEYMFSSERYLSDGRTVWIYSTQHSKSGAHPTEKRVKFVADGYGANWQWAAGLCLDGVLYGDMEDVFTILLRQVDAVTAKPAVLDGRASIHVTGQAAEGFYELWLDPAADYRIFKSIVRKSGDNPLFNKTVSRSAKWSSLEATVTNVAFKDVPGGILVVDGRMRITGTVSPLSSTHFFGEGGETYRFTRTNAKLGSAVTESELMLPPPLDAKPAKNEK